MKEAETQAPPAASRGWRIARRLLLGVALLAAVIVLYFAVVPSPIDPAPYAPPEKPELAGVLAPNDKLRQAELLAVGQINGPEDVAVDSQGRIYAGTEDGKIKRLLTDGKVETFAVTGGRPLGLHFDADENLIVCDAIKGLLSLNPAGKITVLATEAKGGRFGFTNDVDVATDGTIYFSDASTKYGIWEYKADLLESKAYGRLMRYDPQTGDVEVLLDGLYFANGVALSQQEDFVLVNESWRFRIQRVWLIGPQAGTSEIFADNLPGVPDGLSANRRGTFWLALFTTRNDLLDAISPSPFTKTLLAKLPAFMQPQAEPYGLVLALDEQGNITSSLHDPGGKKVLEVTSVEEHDGALYLGTLHKARIARYNLP